MLRKDATNRIILEFTLLLRFGEIVARDESGASSASPEHQGDIILRHYEQQRAFEIIALLLFQSVSG